MTATPLKWSEVSVSYYVAQWRFLYIYSISKTLWFGQWKAKKRGTGITRKFYLFDNAKRWCEDDWHKRHFEWPPTRDQVQQALQAEKSRAREAG